MATVARFRLWLARVVCPRGYEVMGRYKTAVDYRYLRQTQ